MNLLITIFAVHVIYVHCELHWKNV